MQIDFMLNTSPELEEAIQQERSCWSPSGRWKNTVHTCL